MPKKDNSTHLTGHCLIAMPDMADERFRSSLVFLCAHSNEGAMGLIVNKPIQDLNLFELLDQMSIEKAEADLHIPMHFGGPVEPGRGFVLHSTDFHSGLSSQKITSEITMTSTVDILEETAKGNGPEKAIYALGYAGWGEGQLEREIAANGWLTCEVGPDVLFDAPTDQKWALGLEAIGVNPAILSSSGGRA